ncbi:pyrimidine 5 -nucleotidase protein [Rutstroemia sp. NJR-2017a BBW]|nr:pyrimidine 5 -nucleotidase protein [Rutstroemia sp. NJR-2017a BBW]
MTELIDHYFMKHLELLRSSVPQASGGHDRYMVKLWLFTSAYVNHGKRVVRLLGVEDVFEGMTFCDHAQERIICKSTKKHPF